MVNILQKVKNWFVPEKEHDDTMKFLIIGLGNMGAEYDHTRHNVGFDVVDHLADQQGVTFDNETLGDLATFRYKGRHVYLLKPSTYMNLSGKAIRYWVQKLKIANGNWLVVVDEFQFDVGVMKLQKKGSSGGHNGLKSVENMMQSSTYPRLRIGIGHDFPRGRQVDYVLGNWTDEQKSHLGPIFDQASEVVLSFVSIGIDRAMSQHNKSRKTSQ